MLLERYEQDGLLFNINFKDATSEAGQYAYRGELVLIEGEVADAAGRRKPPTAVMRGVVMLVADDKIKLVAGVVDKLDQLSLFVSRYGADLAPGVAAVFYVLNVAAPMKTTVDGLACIVIPMSDGMVWNELLDELALEKGDFKGQSAADKVLTVSGACASYKPKYPEVAWAEALAGVTEVRRSARGPV